MQVTSPQLGSIYVPSSPSTPTVHPSLPTPSPPRQPSLNLSISPAQSPGQERTQQPSSSSDDSSEPVPHLDLPFKDQFTLLPDDLPTSPAIAGLSPRPVDVDRWELVLTPEEYLLRFKDTLATVQLINRAPLRRLHTTYHRGPGFDRWLLMAKANHEIWIDPRYKTPFFTQLDQYQTAQPGQYPLQASQGSAHISTSVFVHCLTEVGCDTLRIKAYGQKTPLIERFLNREPAQVLHRWAEHNEWDIGQTYNSPYIWLFVAAAGRQNGVEHYPMLVPGSNNYGTVNIRSTHRTRNFHIKVYPRLVHVIKSFNSRLQASIPKTLQGIRNQVAGSLRMIHSLSSKDDTALGGFRIEVTVKAKSLREAHRLVTATGFLNPHYWLGIGDGPHAREGLMAKLVTREGLLANANWVYEQALRAKMFTGAAADRPTKMQIQALVDILNGLGWNGGIRRPTKSWDPEAWWHSTQSTTQSNIFHSLGERCQTDKEIKELFEQARGGSHPYTLPCKAQPGNPNHRYQIHNQAPFRVRCSDPDCQHKLQRTALVHWIAELVQEGVIDRTTIGL